MSKLFREMQSAAKQSAERPTSSVGLSELLEIVDEGKEAADTAATATLHGCRTLQLPRLSCPVLMPEEENFNTHAAFEAFRGLRTKLLRAQSTQGIRSVVISSSVQGEGKTLSSLNLGLTVSQLDKTRVLLIDGDVRTGGLSILTGATQGPGLSEVLAGEASFESALLATNIPNLYIVGAGEAKHAPSDLFAGTKWKDFIGWCCESFSLVIVDSPPILGLADFEVISAACDAVLLIVRALKTKREILTHLREHLDEKKILGIVLNGQVHHPGNKYGYNYHYYGYSRDSNGKK